MTTSEDALPKGINDRMPPADVAVLAAARADCWTLANNHVLDRGDAGLDETLATLAGRPRARVAVSANRREISMQTTAGSDDHVTLDVADGTTMRAYVARPAGAGPHPGLLVLQEAFGVNAHIRDVARRFAAAGYLAIAPELFHRTAPGFEGDYGNMQGVMPHLNAMTIPGNEADLRAAFEWLRGEGGADPARIAAVGYCMGGRCAWLANATLPLAAAISYYGGGIAPGLLDRAAALAGPQLLFWGGRDARILPEHYRAVEDALRAAERRYASVVFSQAAHGFFCDARREYDAAAATESWALALAFLRDYAAP